MKHSAPLLSGDATTQHFAFVLRGDAGVQTGSCNTTLTDSRISSCASDITQNLQQLLLGRVGQGHRYYLPGNGLNKFPPKIALMTHPYTGLPVTPNSHTPHQGTLPPDSVDPQSAALPTMLANPSQPPLFLRRTLLRLEGEAHLARMRAGGPQPQDISWPL